MELACTGFDDVTYAPLLWLCLFLFLSSFEMESRCHQQHDMIDELYAGRVRVRQEVVELAARVRAVEAEHCALTVEHARVTQEQLVVGGAVRELEGATEALQRRLHAVAQTARERSGLAREHLARAGELEDVVQAQMLYTDQLLLADHQDLQADMAPEAQQEALRRAVTECGRARTSRAILAAGGNGGGGSGGGPNVAPPSLARVHALHSKLEAQVLAELMTPLVNDPPSEPPRDHRAELERHGLLSQHQHMLNLKAQSNKKIEAFQLQQQSVLNKRAELKRAVAFSLYLNSFVCCSVCLCLSRSLAREIDTKQQMLACSNSRVGSIRAEVSVLSQELSEARVGLARCEALLAELVGPALAQDMVARAELLDAALASATAQTLRTRDDIQRKKALTQQTRQKIIQLTTLEGEKSQQVSEGERTN